MHTEVAVWLLFYCIAHLGAHFVAYIVWFRSSKSVASEQAIFQYHFFSACVLGAISAATVLVVRSSDVLAAAFAIVFAHGIYSLTFLELWTLAQISYSRDVLEKARAGPLDDSVIFELSSVGDRKRAERLATLAKRGLIKLEAGRWTLSPKGRIASGALSILLWLPAIRISG